MRLDRRRRRRRQPLSLASVVVAVAFAVDPFRIRRRPLSCPTLPSVVGASSLSPLVVGVALVSPHSHRRRRWPLSVPSSSPSSSSFVVAAVVVAVGADLGRRCRRPLPSSPPPPPSMPSSGSDEGRLSTTPTASALHGDEDDGSGDDTHRRRRARRPTATNTVGTDKGDNRIRRRRPSCTSLSVRLVATAVAFVNMQRRHRRSRRQSALVSSLPDDGNDGGGGGGDGGSGRRHRQQESAPTTTTTTMATTTKFDDDGDYRRRHRATTTSACHSASVGWSANAWRRRSLYAAPPPWRGDLGRLGWAAAVVGPAAPAASSGDAVSAPRPVTTISCHPCAKGQPSTVGLAGGAGVATAAACPSSSAGGAPARNIAAHMGPAPGLVRIPSHGAQCFAQGTQCPVDI